MRKEEFLYFEIVIYVESLKKKIQSKYWCPFYISAAVPEFS